MEVNFHAVVLLLLLLAECGIAIACYVRKRRRPRDVPIVYRGQTHVGYFHARKEPPFAYRLTFILGCPSYNLLNAQVLLVYDIFDSAHAPIEGKMNLGRMSDVHLTRGQSVLKRTTRISKQSFDKIRVFLDHMMPTARVFLFGLVLEETKGREPTAYYPIMQWVTKKSRVVDLNPAPELPESPESPVASLPQVRKHEILFFLLFASSMTALTACFAPLVDKTTLTQCVWSCVTAVLAGLLSLSASVFLFRVVIARNEAKQAFTTPNPTDTSYAASVMQASERRKIRLFAALVIVSVVSIVVVVVQTISISIWAVNAWAICAVFSISCVNLAWLLCSQFSVFTLVTQQLSKRLPVRRRRVHKSSSVHYVNDLQEGSTVSSNEPKMFPVASDASAATAASSAVAAPASSATSASSTTTTTKTAAVKSRFRASH